MMSGSPIGESPSSFVEPTQLPELWTTEQVSAYTGLPVRTLQDWRSTRNRGSGLGPRWVNLGGRRVRYRVSDIVEWLDRLAEASTSGYMS